MTSKRIVFTYETTLEVEVDIPEGADWKKRKAIINQAWQDFGPECGGQSLGYAYTIDPSALEQLEELHLRRG